MSRPASSDDAIVFPRGPNQKLVAEKAKLSAEAADLRARVGATDMVNAAPTTLDDVTLDELRGALSKALERF